MTGGDRGLLLSIVELGGYPNFAPVYQAAGYDVEMVTSMRKAMSLLKKKTPRVIVAEYNYQRDFRDRTSNLETLFSYLQRVPEVRLIVFYEPKHKPQLDSVLETFSVQASVHDTLPFPIDRENLKQSLQNL